MRCLYCGKELALLKRWTGGGEFCSDAHRQQYQEEYNQLALNRLLQAKPQVDPKKADAKAAEAKAREAKTIEAKTAEAKTKEVKIKDAAPALPKIEAPAALPAVETRSAPLVVEARPAPQPAAAAAAPAPIPEPVEVAVERTPEPEPELYEPEIDEEPAPAEAYGFFLEFPGPVAAPAVASARELGGFDQPMAPVLPRRDAVPLETALVPAGQVVFAPCARVVDYVVPSGERRLEVREFVRSFPVVQVDLAPAGETGLLQTSEESMDILIFPQPPHSAPPLWQENAARFEFGYELGSLARATFRTTGMEDKEEDSAPMAAEEAPEQIETARETREPVRDPRPAAPVKLAVVEPPAPAIAVKPPVKPIAKPVFVRPAPVSIEKPAEKPVEKKPDPVVGMITKPMPLTLHGLPAGRGKTVQVFQTALVGEIETQAPRSNALPLRPVMTLGPAPVVLVPSPVKTEDRKPSERTVLVKPDSRKPLGRPDPRFANGKTRKPEARPEPEVRPVAASVPTPIAVATKAPIVEPVEKVKPAAVVPAPVEPVPDTLRLPEPPAKPSTSLDLGLPKLSFESDGFWSKLPPAGKIGIAAAVVVAIVGFAILALRGSGSTVVANGPQVVAGSPLPAMESGWITDWGAEAGVRRERAISILRPSLNLSDYRIEFQSQMEGKAIGWVFRAKDGRNFYVAKLEVVTAGLEPKVDVVHFAVVDGQAQQHVQSPLPMKVHIDTIYRIRFDAVGDHFSTWVQDEKVDDWTDDRLKIGGVGLYSDRGETMPRPRAVSVVPLVIKR